MCERGQGRTSVPADMAAGGRLSLGRRDVRRRGPGRERGGTQVGPGPGMHVAPGGTVRRRGRGRAPRDPAVAADDATSARRSRVMGRAHVRLRG
eukprot:CAMPEP_0194276872 /NCGR_PEP_ID=MMETSP0169-20130528/9345_1 /TAXON_ID=218684 /ORGANISM="Corethron pennatum, Strain L29A3" /LENGTH=93 /DNA_ID=CAMNT_0039020685 /DNA_START=401 /DNA_END=679 /DNA_ORIENTATION=+